MILSVGVGAEVFHGMQAEENSMQLNTTLELDCSQTSSDCPVNSWRLSWSLPENAEVLSVRDSYGNITDYELDDGQLDISTNSGPPREKETVRIQSNSSSNAEEVHAGLYKRRVSLAGLPNETTRGVIQNPGIVSGWTSGEFNESFSTDEMRFRGRGSTNLRINFGKGAETSHYEFFGGTRENTSLAYEISAGMTGLTKPFKRFPVALMPKNEYEGSVTSWSSGEYVGGSFRMREDLGDRFLPVLVHETVHGLNDRQLKWDRTSSTWFDEGSAKYVESMTTRYIKGKDRTRNLFSDETTYYDMRNGTRYEVTLPSSGDPDRLWMYYQNNRSFMKNWNPRGYDSNRDFGYAYSELVIRNYVVNRNKSLREVYKYLDPGRVITGNSEKWSFYSGIMDLEPCNYESKQRFEECLETINEHDYSVYRVENFTRGGDQIELKPVEIRERDTTNLDLISNISAGSPETTSSFFELLAGFENSLNEFVRGVREWIR